MPRIRVAFKGPLLRERMELLVKGKRLGLSASEIKKELDSSLRAKIFKKSSKTKSEAPIKKP